MAGKVVKSARFVPQAYVVQVPYVAPPRDRTPDAAPDEPEAFDDFLSAGDLGSTPSETASGVATGIPERQRIDIEAVRAAARTLLEDAARGGEALLEQARSAALELIETARNRVQAIEDAARAEGFAHGEHDARAAVDAEMTELLESMRGLVEMAREERHKIIESAEDEIVRLALAVAERVVHRQITVDPETVVEIARNAIARVVDRERIVVRVHPADLETLKEHRERLLSGPEAERLHIVEDQRVDRGGVVIETEGGTIDAKISTQLREARRLLHAEDHEGDDERRQTPAVQAG
jgi:flagellar assembly protein FliH